MWQAAEQLGFDGVSVYDVPALRALECWSVISYCLGATSRIVGVPLVLCNPLRHPALVAKMACDLHALSGGRLVLGMGAGGDPSALRSYGIDGLSMGSRLDRLEEALDLIRRLLAGQTVIHHGPHYRIEGLQGYCPGGPPPLLVGGHGQRLLEIAARHADAVNVGFELPEPEWERLAGQLRRLRPPSFRPLILSHNASAQALSDRRMANLIGIGVRWFFVLFPDLPQIGLMREFAAKVLPRLSKHREV